MLAVKNRPGNAGDLRHRFSLWVGEIPWRRAQQPTPVCLPGESHGQRSLEGCSPWGRKEWGTMKCLSTHAGCWLLLSLKLPSVYLWAQWYNLPWKHFKETRDFKFLRDRLWGRKMTEESGQRLPEVLRESLVGVKVKVKSLSRVWRFATSWPMDWSLPGSSLHGILQVRVLERAAISFSRGSSKLRERAWVSRIPGGCVNLWATRETLVAGTLVILPLGLGILCNSSLSPPEGAVKLEMVALNLLSRFSYSPGIIRRKQWQPPPVLLPGKFRGRRSLVDCSPWGSLSLFTYMHWRRKWQPTPVFLPGESQGRGSLVGYRLWGRTESDTTEVT